MKNKNTFYIMVLALFFSLNASANDILIYKHIQFGDWKTGASEVNITINSMVDQTNPTASEVASLKEAQVVNDGIAVSVGSIYPTGETLSPGDTVNLTLSIATNGNTDPVTTAWSANGGSMSAIVSSGSSPSATWVVPSSPGSYTISTVTQEVNLGLSSKSVTFIVENGTPTMPSFSLSSTTVTEDLTISATGNEDSVDPDGDTLTYTLELLDSSGAVLYDTTSTTMAIDTDSLSLSTGEYSVIYKVSDGTTTVSTSPQTFIVEPKPSLGSGTFTLFPDGSGDLLVEFSNGDKIAWFQSEDEIKFYEYSLGNETDVYNTRTTSYDHQNGATYDIEIIGTYPNMTVNVVETFVSACNDVSDDFGSHDSGDLLTINSFTSLYNGDVIISASSSDGDVASVNFGDDWVQIETGSSSGYGQDVDVVLTNGATCSLEFSWD